MALERIINEYLNGPNLPAEKYPFIFLFTDGIETVHDIEHVKSQTSALKTHLAKLAVGNLATIAFGLDADEALLREIAGELREETQREALERTMIGNVRLIDLVDPPHHTKLFMPFPKQKGITKEWIEAVRRFAVKTW